MHRRYKLDDDDDDYDDDHHHRSGHTRVTSWHEIQKSTVQSVVEKYFTYH